MIHYFNPGHETAVLNRSPYYMAPSNVVAMQRELAFLPAWYADENDVVLTEGESDHSFHSFLSDNLNFKVKAIGYNELANYKNELVAAWGISPQVEHFFNELNREHSINLQVPEWKDEYIYLNSRQAAADCLRSLIELNPEISSELIPRFFTSLDDIEQYTNTTSYRLLAKAPYSSSGRGLLWLPLEGLTRTEKQILHGILKKQGTVSIETVVNKQIDFAMEFIADGKGNIDFAGYSLFETNKKGAYTGNYIGSQKNIETVLHDRIDITLLNKIKEDLKNILKEKYASLYCGCIGVDMMIYKIGNEEYTLHPCVEINMRSNMGLLALRISEKYIDEKSQGKFFLDFDAQEGIAYKKHLEMQEKYPSLFKNNKLISGYLSLCPVNEKTHYRAYLLVI